MSDKLTPEEYEKFGRAMDYMLCEHFDGFALVGFHAITKEPVILTHADDIKTRHALNDLLGAAIAPVPINRPDPDTEPPNGKEAGS